MIDDIRKTLVRACSECNGLASDLPHLDYLERHLALKTMLIQRYHRLLLSSSFAVSDLNLSEQYSFLHAAIHNISVTRAELLTAIGFGIYDIAQIESPFLVRKNADGVTLASLLMEHLTSGPTEDIPDEETKTSQLVHTDNTEVSAPWCSAELYEFIRVENEALEPSKRILNQQSYIHWICKHPTRTAALELPENPQLLAGFDWDIDEFKVA